MGEFDWICNMEFDKVDLFFRVISLVSNLARTDNGRLKTIRSEIRRDDYTFIGLDFK